MSLHPLVLMGALTRASLIAALAWFVWFAAARAGGPLKLLGMALGAWLFVLAALTLFLHAGW